MKYHQVLGQSMSGNPLAEAPETIGPTDFGLVDEQHRYLFTRHLMSIEPQKLLEDHKDYELFRAGDGRVVYFYVLQRRYGRLAYFVKFETAHFAFIGSTVTQVALWRDDDTAIPRGMAEKVFHSYILKEWSTVMSDEQQTEAGKKFWRRQMAVSDAEGFRVGLANLTDETVIWCDVAYQDWVKNHLDAWAPNSAARNLRFLISHLEQNNDHAT